jgi:hypothetical protein
MSNSKTLPDRPAANLISFSRGQTGHDPDQVVMTNRAKVGFTHWVLAVTGHSLPELPLGFHGYLHTAFAQGVSEHDAHQAHIEQRKLARRSGPSLTEERRAELGYGTIKLRLPQDALDRLGKLAAQAGVSRAQYLARLLDL